MWTVLVQFFSLIYYIILLSYFVNVFFRVAKNSNSLNGQILDFYFLLY